jgi:hypothetical protein
MWTRPSECYLSQPCPSQTSTKLRQVSDNDLFITTVYLTLHLKGEWGKYANQETVCGNVLPYMG